MITIHKFTGKRRSRELASTQYLPALIVHNRGKVFETVSFTVGEYEVTLDTEVVKRLAAALVAGK